MKYLVVLLFFVSAAQAQGDYKSVFDALNKHEYDRAESLVSSAAANPKDLVAQYLLGRVYHLKAVELMGINKEEADKLLQKCKTIHQTAVDNKGRDPLNYVGLSYYYQEVDNVQEAMSMLLTAKSMETKDLMTLTEAAKANITLSNLKVADKQSKTTAATNASFFVSRAESIAPENMQVLMASGFVYYSQSVWALAEAKFRKATTVDMKNVEAHFYLAKALYQQKKYKEADAEYKKVIEIDPEYALAYRELAEFYYLWGRALSKADERAGKFDIAKSYAQDYGKRVQDDLSAKVRYLEILFFTNSFEEAATLANELSSKPELSNSITIKRLRGYVLVETNKCTEGLQVLEGLMVTLEDGEVAAIDYKYIAQAYYCLDNMEKTKETIAKAIELDPGAKDFFKEKYEIAKEEKDYEPAYKLLLLHMEIDDNPGGNELFWAAYLANRFKDTLNTIKFADLAIPIYLNKVPDLYLYKARAYGKIAYEAEKNEKPDEQKEAKGKMVDAYEKFIIAVGEQEEGKKEKYNKKMAEAYYGLTEYYYANGDEKAQEADWPRSYKYANKCAAIYEDAGEEEGTYLQQANTLKDHFKKHNITPAE